MYNFRGKGHACHWCGLVITKPFPSEVNERFYHQDCYDNKESERKKSIKTFNKKTNAFTFTEPNTHVGKWNSYLKSGEHCTMSNPCKYCEDHWNE